MPQNVTQQLSSLLYAFSARFNDSHIKLHKRLRSVPGHGQKDIEIYKELNGLFLTSKDEGALNKLAYRVGSAHNSPVKKFLYNTKISSLQISSIENEPLLLVEPEFASGGAGTDAIELIYRGQLKFSWVETDYYFYMSPGPMGAGKPQESNLQVNALKLKFHPDEQYLLLDNYSANDCDGNEHMLYFELSAELQHPVTGMFKYIDLMAKSFIPVEFGETAQLPLVSIDMLIG